jgi:hypothetical protein
MRIRARFLLALMLIALATRAYADEILLKDGSKIIGTIVGFEDDAFKVQTSYGFAMVRKDQILEIIPSVPKPAPAPKPNASPSASKDSKDNDNDSATGRSNAANSADAAPDAPPTPAPDAPLDSPSASPEVAPSASSAAPSHAVSKPTTVRAAPSETASHRSAAAAAGPPAGAPTPVARSASPSAAPAPTPVAAPVADSKPEPIREEIVGNLYINRTYGFDIYKPPDWELLPDEMHSLPNAVAAMGADDSTTLLLIGREARKGELDAQAAATDAQLHDIYDNFRLLSSTHISIAGEPAIERHFRGAAADRDWSVTVVTVAHGSDLFTVLGMTYADSDLIQIQENVIARAISSLRFETP